MALLLPLAWINGKLGFVDKNLIVAALIADVVFCYFNYRPKGRAKCFAGDVGSIAAAFIVLFILGRLILTTGDFTYIVFLEVYGVDAVLTICHRIMLHENRRTKQEQRANAFALCLARRRKSPEGD